MPADGIWAWLCLCKSTAAAGQEQTSDHGPRAGAVRTAGEGRTDRSRGTRGPHVGDVTRKVLLRHRECLYASEDVHGIRTRVTADALQGRQNRRDGI